MTSYGKPAFYRILDINFAAKICDIPIDDKFSNLKEYYQQRYNIEIQNEKQPLLQV